MSSIWQCRNDISRYKNLKYTINNIISKLSISIDNANDVSKQVKDKYRINNEGDTPVVYKMDEFSKKLVATKNYLQYKVIPSIDSSIVYLNRQIYNLQQQENNE